MIDDDAAAAADRLAYDPCCGAQIHFSHRSALSNSVGGKGKGKGKGEPPEEIIGRMSLLYLYLC